MARVSKDEILKACINGIEKSFNEYLEWSYGEWLWNAPEYLLTVNIAKELWNIEKEAKFITLEDNIRYTLKNADAKIEDELPNTARGNGRSDIIFWWGKGTPRGIIEVKNAVYQKKQIEKDLERIYAVLKKDSDIEFGVVAFYIDRHFKSGNAEENIRKRIEEKFKINIEKEASEKGFKAKHRVKKIEERDNDAAYAVAFMIYK